MTDMGLKVKRDVRAFSRTADWVYETVLVLQIEQEGVASTPSQLPSVP